MMHEAQGEHRVNRFFNRDFVTSNFDVKRARGGSVKRWETGYKKRRTVIDAQVVSFFSLDGFSVVPI